MSSKLCVVYRNFFMYISLSFHACWAKYMNQLLSCWPVCATVAGWCGTAFTSLLQWGYASNEKKILDQEQRLDDWVEGGSRSKSTYSTKASTSTEGDRDFAAHLHNLGVKFG